MHAAEFAAFHESALECDEIRNNILLAIIARLRALPKDSGIKFWTLGGPGACAAQTPGYPVVLGDLTKVECQKLAEILSDADYPGVVGADETALWFTERARQCGAEFAEGIQQDIWALHKTCLVPGVPGFPRRPSPKDFPLFKAWTHAFIKEAIPSDPVPSDDALMADLRSRRHWIWIYEDKPVSMAALTRRTRSVAFINSVYTPPASRNRGFASAITAIVVREIFEESRRAAALYVDLRNPASNRCYAKLGFTPVCKSSLVIRSKKPVRPAGSPDPDGSRASTGPPADKLY